jgi:cytochrome c biogenesis protein CcdA
VSFGIGTYGIALVAGLLTTLSPCVLPLIPVLMGSAVSAHRLGPWALAVGVALSFTVAGVLLASVGASLGLDGETFRRVAALLMAAFGLILISGRLQALFARATSGLSNSGHALLARYTLDGLGGQFALGLLLGIVWSPCVGPTLGAATTLATQGRNLAQISLLMAVFGLGASLPLLLIGSLSRVVLLRIRGSLKATGERGKQVLGLALLLLGALILFHADHRLEAWLLDHSPAWLTALTTQY